MMCGRPATRYYVVEVFLIRVWPSTKRLHARCKAHEGTLSQHQDDTVTEIDETTYQVYKVMES